MSSKVSLCFLLWSFLQTSRFVNLDSCWWIKLQDELVLLDNSIWEQTFWFQLVRLMDYWIFRALNWSFPLHIFYQDVSLREGSKKNYESLDISNIHQDVHSIRNIQVVSSNRFHSTPLCEANKCRIFKPFFFVYQIKGV